jgi:hypothetical protein
MLMSNLPKVLALLMLVACFAVNVEATETVDSILNRYIEAVGGKETIEMLASRVCSGKEINDFSSGDHPSYESWHLQAHYKTPTSYCIETWSSEGGYSEGFDGRTSWVKDKCGVRTEPVAGGNKLAFLLDPRGPLHVELYFPELKYVGMSAVNGKEVHALEPANLKPAHYKLYFSSETGLLVAIGHYWSLEDYRRVDGVIVPHRLSVSRKGGSTVYELESIVHNVEINDSLFAKPE